MVEILAALITILSAVAGNFIFDLIKPLFEKKETAEISYGEKMAALTQSLSTAPLKLIVS